MDDEMEQVSGVCGKVPTEQRLEEILKRLCELEAGHQVLMQQRMLSSLLGSQPSLSGCRCCCHQR